MVDVLYGFYCVVTDATYAALCAALYMKISTCSAPPPTTTSTTHSVLYEAGTTARDAQQPATALLLLNLYLDVAEAIDERSPSSLPEQSPFQGADVVWNTQLPAVHYASQEEQETVRVLACSWGFWPVHMHVKTWVAVCLRQKCLCPPAPVCVHVVYPPVKCYFCLVACVFITPCTPTPLLPPPLLRCVPGSFNTHSTHPCTPPFQSTPAAAAAWASPWSTAAASTATRLWTCAS